MIAALSLWYPIVAGVIALPVTGMFGWIAYLVYCDSQDIEIHAPRFIPWSVASKLRARKLEVELTKAEIDLAEAQHTRAQKRMILDDLEDHRMKRALTKGQEEVAS